ncbi:hypothetical protein [Massilia sp. Se16.2.3]|nr:hypothetical protein [Massilia sp. Se16.2.3]
MNSTCQTIRGTMLHHTMHAGARMSVASAFAAGPGLLALPIGCRA